MGKVNMIHTNKKLEHPYTKLMGGITHATFKIAVDNYLNLIERRTATPRNNYGAMECLAYISKHYNLSIDSKTDLSTSLPLPKDQSVDMVLPLILPMNGIDEVTLKANTFKRGDDCVTAENTDGIAHLIGFNRYVGLIATMLPVTPSPIPKGVSKGLRLFDDVFTHYKERYSSL